MSERRRAALDDGPQGAVALPSSFRDPSGYLFSAGGILYRHVNPVYAPHYEHLMRSGLYEELVRDGLLVPHEAVPALSPAAAGAMVLRPELIPFVSYPYEWCFGQLKDAALLTLDIQRRARARGMTLRDATAYNVQFRDAKPVWIDTLSFGIDAGDQPWVAYRQFCQFFLAPLALMSLRDPRLSQLFRSFIDGVPLEIASPLLPLRSRLRPGLAVHLHLQAAAQSRLAGRAVKRKPTKMQPSAIAGVLDSLERTVRGMDWTPAGTIWGDYYGQTNYSSSAAEHKAGIINEYLDRVKPATVWDLGANTGRFSRLASSRGIATIAFDFDHAAVEKNYRACREQEERSLLPLVMDLTNPSAGIGWGGEERQSLVDRGPADLVLALALVHHLAIGNNVPFERIADFLSELGRWLAIEFVPKGDSQVQRLLATREDVFAGFEVGAFERAFTRRFTIEQVTAVRDTERAMYLMRRRG